jgi:hypothetical protein
LFVLTLAAFFALLLAWSFRTLPGERWQIIASVPIAKDDSGRWRGLNLTYYGLFTAISYGFALAVLLILMGSLQVPLCLTLTAIAAVLCLCVPASRLVARAVEKKSYTFTVAGAFFVGILFTPWIIEIINRVCGATADMGIPTIPALSAISIAYAFGEGIGRLACISFGCCYGKPLSQSHPILRRVFENLSFTFHGKTKKIAYASGMDGEKVIPVQAITSVLYVATGLTGIWLFLQSHFLASFILQVSVTQCWRTLSETLRADYRGEGKVTAYQVMGIAAVIYSLTLPPLLPPAPVSPPDLMAGLFCIWSPLPIIFLWALSFAIFIYTGRSMVTGSTLSFHVIKDRI